MLRARVGLLLRKHFPSLLLEKVQEHTDGGKRRDTFPLKWEERREREV